MSFILFLSDCIVPIVVFYIVGFGLLSGRPVLDDFIRGAKDGMKTVAGILPTLIGLMTAVGVLRVSGFLDFLASMLQTPAAWLHLPSPIIPLVLVRMISNSAATGMVVDLFRKYGTDSNIGMMASILMSCTETVLYCVSIYFGSIGIKKTGYALPGALLATAAGVAASILITGYMV